MLSKEKVRKKFFLLRKKKYREVKKNFFYPLIQLIRKKNKKNISLYYPSNFEVNTLKLFDLLKNIKHSSTSLPIICKGTNIKFVKWKFPSPLVVNIYGFLEPAEKKKIVLPDLILIPLLAYDKSFNRLGYGKGYYDRFLNKYRKINRNLLIIGVAFSFQKYKKIPISKFDVKLDHILTEKGLL